MRVSFVIYKNLKLFQESYGTTTKAPTVFTQTNCLKQVSTEIVSAATNIKYNNNNDVIILYFQDTADLSSCSNKVYSCVFYNYLTSDWEKTGCTYSLVDQSTHQCVCNHLTNFAVLVVISFMFFFLLN